MIPAMFCRFLEGWLLIVFLGAELEAVSLITPTIDNRQISKFSDCSFENSKKQFDASIKIYLNIELNICIFHKNFC